MLLDHGGGGESKATGNGSPGHQAPGAGSTDSPDSAFQYARWRAPPGALGCQPPADKRAQPDSCSYRNNPSLLVLAATGTGQFILTSLEGFSLSSPAATKSPRSGIPLRLPAGGTTAAGTVSGGRPSPQDAGCRPSSPKPALPGGHAPSAAEASAPSALDRCQAPQPLRAPAAHHHLHRGSW